MIKAERARRAAECDRRNVEANGVAIRARCQSLAGFVKEAWHILEPNTTLIWNWHLDAICLPGETEIMTDVGPMRIDAIVGSKREGKVLSFNHATGAPEWREVIRYFDSPRGHLFAFATRSGLRFKATGNHPVYVLGRGYVRADEVRVGDRITEMQKLHGGDQISPVRQSGVLQPGLPVCISPEDDSRGEGAPLPTVRNDISRSSHRPGRQEQFSAKSREPVPPVPCRAASASACLDYGTVEGVVASIEREVQLSDTLYNLEVEGNNNYFASGILVHNCNHLEAVTDGRINRLLINVPPGSSKSLLVSVLWPAWEWGAKGLRSLRYISTSYNDGPVKRDVRKTRDLIMSTWFKGLWPELVLTRTGETSFANTDTGTREGIPFGSLTSQRGDRLLIDDPHSTETAESDAERKATTRKFREGAVNRLNDQERSAIVVIMQRLHSEDLSGVIQSLGMGYVHVMLPMEYEPKRHCRTVIGFSDPRTYDGELLDPVRFGPVAVAGLKRDMGSYAFAGQYQQRPTPREGGMFKRQWFEGKIINIAPANLRMVRHWDLAGTEGGTGARTAGVKIGESFDGSFYVMNSITAREESPEVRRIIKATAELDGAACHVSLPQDPGQAGKGQKLDYAKLLAGFLFHAEPETGDKPTRAGPFAAQCEAGNVYLIRGEWTADYIEELCSFPGGSLKDQVDASSGAFLRLMQTRGQTINFHVPTVHSVVRALPQ